MEHTDTPNQMNLMELVLADLYCNFAKKDEAIVLAAVIRRTRPGTNATNWQAWKPQGSIMKKLNQPPTSTQRKAPLPLNL